MDKKRVLIDTNVVLDFLLKRANYEIAFEIINLAVNNEVIEFLTATTITDINFLSMKYSNPKMDSYTVQEKIKDLLKIIDILPVLKSDIEKALELHWLDMEDALQYSVALTNKCDCIVTNNTKDFEKAEIEVLNPYDFINKYFKELDNDEYDYEK